jgi:hypothetical protein
MADKKLINKLIIDTFKKRNNLNDEIQDSSISAAYVKNDGSLTITLNWGKKPTGGYIIRISSISIRDNTIEIDYFTKSPGPRDMVTHAITYPKDTRTITVGDEAAEYDIKLNRIVK